MTNVILSNLQSDLGSFISKALSEDAPLRINTEEGSVVLVSEKEWDSLQETLLILKDSKSLTALLKGHSDRITGIEIQAVSPEVAFYDL